MQAKDNSQDPETFNPEDTMDFSSGTTEELIPAAPLCTALLKRGLGPACRAPSMLFDGFNIDRCGRHRLCHGSSVKIGIRCESYVYRGNTRCAACQRDKEDVDVITLASENGDSPALTSVAPPYSQIVKKGEEKKQEKNAVDPPKKIGEQPTQTQQPRRSPRLKLGKTALNSVPVPAPAAAAPGISRRQYPSGRQDPSSNAPTASHPLLRHPRISSSETPGVLTHTPAIEARTKSKWPSPVRATTASPPSAGAGALIAD